MRPESKAIRQCQGGSKGPRNALASLMLTTVGLSGCALKIFLGKVPTLTTQRS